ncbi:hypothetical protein SOVF_204690 isoform B [Spinacia oleracea]|nr:hypothetical protein SOVF_204690 isoform B [Spinacia oleracea]
MRQLEHQAIVDISRTASSPIVVYNINIRLQLILLLVVGNCDLGRGTNLFSALVLLVKWVLARDVPALFMVMPCSIHFTGLSIITLHQSTG